MEIGGLASVIGERVARAAVRLHSAAICMHLHYKHKFMLFLHFSNHDSSRQIKAIWVRLS